MKKEDKIQELKRKISQLDQEIGYYDALQQGLKLVLNGSYGAYASSYFVLFDNNVAGSITAEGRELTKTMSDKNEDYWYNQWHLDEELHKTLYIKYVEQIPNTKPVSVYGDTDSIFVGFEPAIDSCEWKDRIFNDTWLNKCPYPYIVIKKGDTFDHNIKNDNYKGVIYFRDEKLYMNGEEIESIPEIKLLAIDGSLIKDYKFIPYLKEVKSKTIYNWGTELEFMHGLDHFKIAAYFKDELDKHAHSYGVDNLEDFELEKISESIINLEKKKYIQHITWEEGINYERLKYFQPKGVELIRSSTPQFARDEDMGIYKVVKYLFNHPRDFNIQELTEIVRGMRTEFELADINDISGQSSCSNYEKKVLNDKDALEFVSGAHFGVKAAAFHNYLLNQRKELQTRYEFLKSGDKIKYYYTKDPINPIFGFKRGEYPIEFGPDVDYDTQFDKVILSPINNIIKKLGMPEINKRLSVLVDIFANL